MRKIVLVTEQHKTGEIQLLIHCTCTCVCIHHSLYMYIVHKQRSIPHTCVEPNKIFVLTKYMCTCTHLLYWFQCSRKVPPSANIWSKVIRIPRASPMCSNTVYYKGSTCVYSIQHLYSSFIPQCVPLYCKLHDFVQSFMSTTCTQIMDHHDSTRLIKDNY